MYCNDYCGECKKHSLKLISWHNFSYSSTVKNLVFFRGRDVGSGTASGVRRMGKITNILAHASMAHMFAISPARLITRTKNTRNAEAI